MSVNKNNEISNTKHICPQRQQELAKLLGKSLFRLHKRGLLGLNKKEQILQDSGKNSLDVPPDSWHIGDNVVN